MWDEYVQARMNAGSERETVIIRELMGLGYEWVHGQQKFEDKKLGVVGKIEGRLKKDGWIVPVEIKTMNPNMWGRINTVEDLFDKWWTKKYFYQVQTYLWGNNEPVMLLLLDDCLGHWKIIPVPLDYDRAELMAQQYERVEAAVQSGVDPEPIPYDAEICGGCNFKHVCPVPVSFGDGLRPLGPDVADLITTVESYADFAKAHENAKKELKEALKGHDMAIAGNWGITGKEINVKGREVPARTQAPYSYWLHKWTPLDK